MTRRTFFGLASASLAAAKPSAPKVDSEAFRHYVEDFNRAFKGEVVNYIPDAQAWDWMTANVPFFSCPDGDIEQLHYYRWWTYRKHIKQTPEGFFVTEFLKPVKHAAEYNALSCALGHHINEGRWIRDMRFLDGDIHFWLETGENGGIRHNLHQFSGWTAAALYDRWLADGRRDFLLARQDALIRDYEAWERERLTESGLFWQRDVSDGMEESISGGRRVKNLRPSINAYMFGNARAIAAIARLSGRGTVEREYAEKAANLKRLVEERLWNTDAAFFETRLESGDLAGVREEIGFTPWCFNLPGDRYSAAWKQLMDPGSFYAPFGPTTAERRNPGFKIAYQGDDCQWNGPSWPFATTITLKALANVLNDYRQEAISRDDYFRTFQIYTRSQHLKLDDGRVMPFVDEDLNPLTGEWLARARKMRKPGFYGRGDHYNHSGYADLVITGIAGLRPRGDDTVEVNPLAPRSWDWFAADRIPYHGRTLAIFWDRTGSKFGRGGGLAVYADGREIARAPGLSRLTARL